MIFTHGSTRGGEKPGSCRAPPVYSTGWRKLLPIIPAASFRKMSKGGRCLGDPSVLHGPYYNLTRKVNGKTITVRFNHEEAKILQERIYNVRKLDRVVSRMVEVTLEAVDKNRS